MKNTYLIVSNALFGWVFEWHVCSNSWHSEGSVFILFISNNISAIWLGGLAQVSVGLNLLGGWLSVNAPSSVPRIVSCDVLDTVNEIWSSVCLPLTQVL